MLAATVALGTVLALAAPSAATAQPIVSQANGRLLSGSLLSSAVLDSLLTLKGANAVNTAANGDVVVDTPLDASAVNGLLTLMAGPANAPVFGNAGIVQLGAVGQYARANNDGSSAAFSGTVSAAPSLVGVGTGAVTPSSSIGTPTAGSSAEIAVGTAALLGGVDAVTVKADLGVLAASAQQTTAKAQSGQYGLADFTVTVGGTLVTGPVSTIRPALESLISTLQLAGVTGLVDPFAADFTLTLTAADLQAAGLGADLNNLPADTDLMQYIPLAASQKITALTSGFLTSAATAVANLPTGPTRTGAELVISGARTVVDPIVASLGSAFQGALGLALTGLVQVVANHQEVVDGTFTQTALRVGLGARGSLATVNLASASVGPNAGPPSIEPSPSATATTGTGGAGGNGGTGGDGSGGGTGSTLAHTGISAESQLLPWGGFAFAILLVGFAGFALTARRRNRGLATKS
ncbi:hypothetical protein C5B96_14990 [Subtercola sp. Z020]|nr:hypothetical protein C5B96_14990 [Subtercola sp. Z020]